MGNGHDKIFSRSLIAISLYDDYHSYTGPTPIVGLYCESVSGPGSGNWRAVASPGTTTR